jgi:DNA-binding NarL/FixJ family response regulator
MRASPPPSGESAGISPAGKLRVLLADDHPIVRTGLADMLRELQEVASVVEARDGQEAVELATQIRPDLVVMDITMPRLNGIEATRRIKTLLPGARVIGLSMHDTVEMTRAMRDAGAVECLRKDAASDELIVSILSQAGRA